MLSRRWMIVSVLAATPALGFLGYELGARAQYAPQPAPQQYPPPQYQQPPQLTPQQQQQQAQMEQQQRAEMQIELRKAQIQATLAERIAQVKEDARQQLRNRTPAADDGQLLEAEADVAASRANADIAKLNTQLMDLQMRNAQVLQQGGPQANAITQQLLQMELKKAQIQTGLQRQIVGIRQRQFERLRQAMAGGQVPQEAMTEATLEFESARATVELVQLDEQLIAGRLQAAGGRP